VPTRMALVSEVGIQQTRAVRLKERIASMNVFGAARLSSRVESEVQGLQGACVSRLAGATNNLAAVEWELDVCDWAPDPVWLSRSIRPPSCNKAVSVDVIAAGGQWWLEAKASLPFGLGSTAWVDLMGQLDRLTCNARASFCGRRRPQVIVVFRHACPDEVRAALRGRGVGCICARSDGKLPPPMAIDQLVEPRLPLRLHVSPRATSLPDETWSPPSCLLLDVSSLLCLLSTSCRVSSTDSRLISWAAHNEHWARSLREEVQSPLLPTLSRLLEGHCQWKVRASELERCDAVVLMAGGAAERARWAALRPLLLVLDERIDECTAAGNAKAAGATSSSKGGTSGGAESAAEVTTEPLQAMMSALEQSMSSVSKTHLELLLDVAAADALLCTANGRLLRRVPEHVHVRAHVHSARWLVGDVIPLDADEAWHLDAEPRTALLGTGRRRRAS